jgi:pimeloyl-ACP methyl ester carboxylesterase
MPTKKVNGLRIFYELAGEKGDPLVLVHGSWGDHHNWDPVAGELAKTFRVLTYDRRGHSQSERVSGQGWVAEDVDDLIALVEQLKITPAHIVGNSFGASIVLKAAARRPDVFRSMIIHEPPLFGLLQDSPNAQTALNFVSEEIKNVLSLIAAGSMEKAAEQFVDKIALGPDSWEHFPDMAKKTFVYNATTWYDELQDPDSLQIDLPSLAKFDKPSLLSAGSESPPLFRLVIDQIKESLPQANQITINGVGHVPHMSHSENYIEIVKSFCQAA